MLHSSSRGPIPPSLRRRSFIAAAGTLFLVGSCGSPTDGDLARCRDLGVGSDLARVMYWGEVAPLEDRPNEGIPTSFIKMPLWYRDDAILVYTAAFFGGPMVRGVFEVSINPQTYEFVSVQPAHFPYPISSFDYVPTRQKLLVAYSTSPGNFEVALVSVEGPDPVIDSVIVDASRTPWSARADDSGRIVYYSAGAAPGFFQLGTDSSVDSLLWSTVLGPSEAFGFDIVADTLYFGQTIGASSSSRSAVSRDALGAGDPPVVIADLPNPASRAEAGRNFYERHNVIGAVTERFPHAFRAKASRGSRVGDALCSAHAPFNLFAPLRSELSSGAAARVLNAMLAANVDHVDSIAFEQPASRNQSPLGDNTAFDSLISATARGRPLRVGVEVKFTEGPYGWGKSEKKRMLDSGGLYNVATKSGERFQPNAAVQLRNCHLKQLWRNMLLAQELSTRLNVPFYYVHLCPEGNVYQAAVVASFAQTLTERGAALFCPVTYEVYFQILAFAGCDADWVSYLRRRYLVGVV